MYKQANQTLQNVSRGNLSGITPSQHTSSTTSLTRHTNSSSTRRSSRTSVFTSDSADAPQTRAERMRNQQLDFKTYIAQQAEAAEHELRARSKPTLRRTKIKQDQQGRPANGPQMFESDLTWLRNASDDLSLFCTQWRQALLYANAVASGQGQFVSLKAGRATKATTMVKMDGAIAARNSTEATAELLATLRHVPPRLRDLVGLHANDLAIERQHCADVLAKACRARRSLTVSQHGYWVVSGTGFARPADELPDIWSGNDTSSSHLPRLRDQKADRHLQRQRSRIEGLNAKYGGNSAEMAAASYVDGFASFSQITSAGLGVTNHRRTSSTKTHTTKDGPSFAQARSSDPSATRYGAKPMEDSRF